MKKRIVLRCDANDLFDAFLQSFVDGYEKVKGVKPTEEQMAHGCAYQAVVPTKKDNKIFAQVKALKYVRPTEFKMDYKSKTYHKIDYCHIMGLNNGKVELLFETYIEQYDAAGNVARTQGSYDSENIAPCGLLESINYRRLASQLRARRRAANTNYEE